MRNKFKNTVDSGELIGTRVGLTNELLLDPRGGSFKEMREYAEDRLPDLYEQHDGEELDMDHDHWTESVLFDTKNALEDNFSRERLDYYCQMAKVVLKDKADALDREKAESEESNASSSPYGSGNSKKCGPDMLAVGLTVGGLLIGGTAMIAGRTAITVLGLAASAIGGVMLYKDSRK